MEEEGVDEKGAPVRTDIEQFMSICRLQGGYKDDNDVDVDRCVIKKDDGDGDVVS